MLRRVWDLIKAWLGRFRDDLASSTDASVLGVLRFFGLLYGPIDTTLPIDQAFKKALKHRLPAHVGWRHALGGIAYLLFMMMVGTGVLLAFYYRPSAEEAYQSIQQIVSGVTLGWLIRDLHVWGANLIVLAVLAHMAYVFFSASYKPPRETNWLMGLLLLGVILAFGATGYLLPWDQWAYWTTTQGLSMVEHLPIVGGVLVTLLRGDPIVSGATLSRFFAIHVIVLPWCAVVFLVLHFRLVRKHGIAPPVRPVPAPAAGTPFFPHHLTRLFAVAMVVLAVTVTAAVLSPREVGPPADPGQFPDLLRTSWIVADVSRALVHYTGGVGLTAFAALGLVLAVLPLFDRGPERDFRRRPAVTALGIFFFASFALAWVAGRQLRGQSISREEQAATTAVVPADTMPSRRTKATPAAHADSAPGGASIKAPAKAPAKAPVKAQQKGAGR